MTIKDISSILNKIQTEIEKKIHNPDGNSTNPAALKQALTQLKAAQTYIKRSEMVWEEEKEEVEG